MLGIFGCFFFLTIETLFFLFVVFTREKKKKNKEHKTFSGVGANDKRELPRLAPSQTVGSSSFGLGEVIHTHTHTRVEREREREYRLSAFARRTGEGEKGGGVVSCRDDARVRPCHAAPVRISRLFRPSGAQIRPELDVNRFSPATHIQSTHQKSSNVNLTR